MRGERLTARITGRVQGVGFRWWVRRHADALGLSGWVMNDNDERAVELVAEGPPDAPWIEPSRVNCVAEYVRSRTSVSAPKKRAPAASPRASRTATMMPTSRTMKAPAAIAVVTPASTSPVYR